MQTDDGTRSPHSDPSSNILRNGLPIEELVWLAPEGWTMLQYPAWGLVVVGVAAALAAFNSIVFLVAPLGWVALEGLARLRRRLHEPQISLRAGALRPGDVARGRCVLNAIRNATLTKATVELERVEGAGEDETTTLVATVPLPPGDVRAERAAVFQATVVLAYLPQSRLVAMRAPSTMELNLAQHTSPWPTREPMPQSVPAITRSRPTILA